MVTSDDSRRDNAVRLAIRIGRHAVEPLRLWMCINSLLRSQVDSAVREAVENGEIVEGIRLWSSRDWFPVDQWRSMHELLCNAGWVVVLRAE